MSTDDHGRPLSAPAAKKRLLAALAEGKVSFTQHAREEMANDAITEDQALAVLRGGVVEPPEFRGASWRYRVRAGRLYVVAAFAPDRTVVVTAWRVKR